MHRLFSIAVPFAIASLTATACGGGGSSSPTAREAMEEAIDMLCSKSHECRTSFPDGDGLFALIFQANEGACVSFFTQFLDPAEIQASVDAGRITYSASDAEACVDFQAGLTCEQWWSDTTVEPAACERAFVGQVADGDACTTALDCSAAESSCDAETMTCEPE
jgi:hypothetical protein